MLGRTGRYQPESMQSWGKEIPSDPSVGLIAVKVIVSFQRAICYVMTTV